MIKIYYLKMKIFKDIITGDEIFINSYSMTVGYEDAIIKLHSKLMPKDPWYYFGIGYCDCLKNVEGVCKPFSLDVENKIEKVIDIVENSELKPVNMSKKEFKLYIKNYFN